MADAKQCDRCKKFYSPIVNIDRPSIRGNYIHSVKFMGSDCVSLGPSLIYDLCEDCTKKLVNFMRIEEDNDA